MTTLATLDMWSLLITIVLLSAGSGALGWSPRVECEFGFQEWRPALVAVLLIDSQGIRSYTPSELEAIEMKILMGLLVLIVGLVLSLPFLIDLNKYQDQYKPLIEEALNRKIQLQDIRLTVWPRIGARVAGFAVLDDPAFGSGPFASLSSLDVGVKLMPLLSSIALTVPPSPIEYNHFFCR
ncbi:MAG: AsmA family protein [Nitrospira sp.]|nr:AsmA family protein [Nitrospira sp.]